MDYNHWIMLMMLLVKTLELLLLASMIILAKIARIMMTSSPKKIKGGLDLVVGRIDPI